MVVDIDVESTVHRLDEIRAQWDRFARGHPDHLTVRALAAQGVRYEETGMGVFSMFLPSNCTFVGQPPSSCLLGQYRQARHLPPGLAAITIRNGCYVQGIITAETLTGSRGLLNHIFQHHGSSDRSLGRRGIRAAVREATRFVSRIQRMTTCASLYAYCPSIGLDDCLLPARVRTAARSVLQTHVSGLVNVPRIERLPYRMENIGSSEETVATIAQMRAASERLIVRHTSGRSNHLFSYATSHSVAIHLSSLCSVLYGRNSFNIQQIYLYP